jgi:AGZA family xanthine/uracil permease-like MFS transporter
MTAYRWASRGDVNAFFGLILDNLAVLVLLVTLLTFDGVFTPTFVIERMLPGTALGVVVGDLVYTWLAFRLARRTGQEAVTAMPLGLDTPSTIAVAFLVLKPVAKIHGGDPHTAMVFAWHVGAVVLIMSGLFKTAIAPLGDAVRRWVPRAGLLGSLAAVALVLIAFMPLVERIVSAPLAGFLALTVILVTLVARQPLPGHFPAALAALLVGAIAYYVCWFGGWLTGWPLVPPLGAGLAAVDPLPPMPAEVWTLAWWETVMSEAVGRMPLILPFALATVIGGIDCTESAAAAGDSYDTRSILLTEGLATLVAGLFGGVVQNTPYIGHPAYKAMGGRAAYTLAVAVAVGILGCFGGFATVFHWLPEAALFPILIFVGLEITAQSYAATPKAHYPAVALAVLPTLAYLVMIFVNQAVFAPPPNPHLADGIQTLRCLANGFVVISLLWASLLAELLDGRPLRAAIYLGVAALCSLFGLIHSPFTDMRIDWPWTVTTAILEDTAKGAMAKGARYQTPWHWAAAYLLSAALVLVLAQITTFKAHEEPAEPKAPTP